MSEKNLGAYIIPGNDPHMSEYPASNWKTREWISGFSGSYGTLVVTGCDAALWTDGRYFIQAESQLEGSGIELMRLGLPDTADIADWIKARVKEPGSIGFNGKLISISEYSALAKKFAGNNYSLVSNECLPETIWEGSRKEPHDCQATGYESVPGVAQGDSEQEPHDCKTVSYESVPGVAQGSSRPGLPEGQAFEHVHAFAGMTVQEKLLAIRSEMKKALASHYIISGLDDIAWLFNIRGKDIPYLPVIYAYACISEEEAFLCVSAGKIPHSLAETLERCGIAIRGYEDFAGIVASIPAGARLALDPRKTSRWLSEAVGASVTKVTVSDFAVQLKAIKNDTEIENYRRCQIRDGAVMVEFLFWLEKSMESSKSLKPLDVHNNSKSIEPTYEQSVSKSRGLSEWDCVLKLRELRAKAENCYGESFSSIIGYGANGAMMHYLPDCSNDVEIRDKGLLIVDCGGQYLDGTTDITRTIAFNETTDEEKKCFTLTLKAHIALAGSRFLYGATGTNIDVIARSIMWQEGLDYKSGTGHGVGCFLNVHEGPHSISMRANSARLEENMLISIEPGVYKEGRFGVRTENVARICEDFVNECGRFMKFEVLSLCPISLKGIVPEMLTENELSWLNSYHERVYQELSPCLDSDKREWLRENTKPLTQRQPAASRPRGHSETQRQ